MKCLWLVLNILSFSLVSTASYGVTKKLTPRQVMECMAKEERTRSAFHDAEAALQMRIVSTKQFSEVMTQAKSCADLQAGLKKLGKEFLAGAPSEMPRSNFSSSSSGPEDMPTMPSFPSMPKETTTTRDFYAVPENSYQPHGWDSF